MKIIIYNDYENICRAAADLLLSKVASKKDSVLGLATGSTFLGVYKAVRESAKSADFSAVSTFNLVEYAGLEPSDTQSYRHYMDINLFSHINIVRKNTHFPDGMAKDLALECQKYDALIESLGGIDIQFLGLGLNGHIGFNEPADSFMARTHAVTLSESTRKANSRFFESLDAVPKKALTMGIGSIMHAKQIVLLVSGKEKAEILRTALRGPIIPSVPCSVLQLHRDVTVIADTDAGKFIC